MIAFYFRLESHLKKLEAEKKFWRSTKTLYFIFYIFKEGFKNLRGYIAYPFKGDVMIRGQCNLRFLG